MVLFFHGTVLSDWETIWWRFHSKPYQVWDCRDEWKWTLIEVSIITYVVSKSRVQRAWETKIDGHLSLGQSAHGIKRAWLHPGLIYGTGEAISKLSRENDEKPVLVSQRVPILWNSGGLPRSSGNASERWLWKHNFSEGGNGVRLNKSYNLKLFWGWLVYYNQGLNR